MDMPEEARKILDTLEESGHEAYLVGGCVRDALLGRTAHDFDIATNALPKEVSALFEKTFMTGLKHGTVTVHLNGKDFEVTTYRIDGEYEDGRHPDSVTFTPSLLEDLKRRDFTINAFAYSPKCGLVDAFEGRKDLENHVIRAVGNPERRFQEDALRLLRAMRFCAQLDFHLEEETKKAIVKTREGLRKIAWERIQEELVKMILSPHPEILFSCHRLGLTGIFLPEFDDIVDLNQETPYHDRDVARHTIDAMRFARKDILLQLVLLFHDMGKAKTKIYDQNGIAHFYRHEVESARIAQNILERLRFPKKLTQHVVFLVLHHGDVFQPTSKSVRREMAKVGKENFPLLLEIQRADSSAQSALAREDHFRRLDAIEKIYGEERKKAECFSLKDLAVHGNDLLDFGVPKGPEVGKVLSKMLKHAIDFPEDNSKEYLLSHIADFRN